MAPGHVAGGVHALVFLRYRNCCNTVLGERRKCSCASLSDPGHIVANGASMVTGSACQAARILVGHHGYNHNSKSRWHVRDRFGVGHRIPTVRGRTLLLSTAQY